MTSNGSASKTRMVASVASSPQVAGVLGALISLGTIFHLHDLLNIEIEEFAIAMGALITILSWLGAWLKSWLARLGIVAVLLAPAGCNFTEGLAAASSTLRDLEPGFEKFAVVVRIEARKTIVKAEKQRFLCEHKRPAVDIKRCMGIWWIVDRKFSPKLRGVIEKLPAGAQLGPEALDAAREGVELLAAIDGLRE